ncbi:oligosaccharyl transferase subunit OST3/OST6 family [Gloeopeniophorella convolvens]|nr:oligosaccharyl transferase subunit OST3/OST6 family [Gloeopeniophorella convolvens]
MLFPFFLLLALPAIALAAKESTHDKLVKLAAGNNGVIKLDAKSFDLLTAPKRDWSASIHFTALDKRRRCGPCKEFEPSWVSVAKAWSKVPAAERDSHFFATLDFDDGQTVFQKLGLQSAPVVLNYAPAAGPRKSANPDLPITYDFSSGFDALPLAEQLSGITPVPIPYSAPINWAMWGTVTFFALAGALAIRFLAPVLRSRWTWAGLTVIVSLVMTSGYMFTRIRGMPNAAADGSWIAPGFQSQYGQETTVVASLYGLLSASFLMLTLVAPLQTSPTRQRAQIYLWSGVIMILFSVLVSFFRVKNRGYPFKLIL